MGRKGINLLGAAAAALLGTTAARASGGSAAALPAVGKPKAAGATFTLQVDHQSYTNGFGIRTIVSGSARVPLGRGANLQLGASSGERQQGGKTMRGSGVTAVLHFPVAVGLTSRTTIAAGEVGPLFARRAIGEDLVLKIGRTEVRAGGRLSRYGEGLDVRSFHGGLQRSIGPFRLDYSVAAYGRKGSMASGLIHRFDGALDDGHGTTHLLLAAGNSLHEHDFRPDKVNGSFRYVALKRKQKLQSGLALELTGGWTAFDRPVANYGAARVNVGLVLSRQAS